MLRTEKTGNSVIKFLENWKSQILHLAVISLTLWVNQASLFPSLKWGGQLMGASVAFLTQKSRDVIIPEERSTLFKSIISVVKLLGF